MTPHMRWRWVRYINNSKTKDKMEKLIMRALLAKKNVSEKADPNKIEKGDKVGRIGWLVGYKTDTPEVYGNCVIASDNIDIVDRYVGDVDCRGGVPNIPSAKGISIILADEQPATGILKAKYSLLAE